jgi:hypothetical protein
MLSDFHFLIRQYLSSESTKSQINRIFINVWVLWSISITCLGATSGDPPGKSELPTSYWNLDWPQLHLFEYPASNRTESDKRKTNIAQDFICSHRSSFPRSHKKPSRWIRWFLSRRRRVISPVRIVEHTQNTELRIWKRWIASGVKAAMRAREVVRSSVHIGVR